MNATEAGRTRAAFGLAAVLGTSGALHFKMPRQYGRIVPAPLKRWDRQVVAVSGVAEIVCAALLVAPPTRRLGGLASAALLIAVFPANVQMALDGGYPDAPFPANNRALAWLRLPLQVPLIGVALRAAGRR
ncbi:MAG: DoxX family protein [Candidatus Dormibacteria bacterium]